MSITPEQKLVIMRIAAKFASLGHDLTFVEPVTTGPIVTTYRFAPKINSKLTQITSLSEDLAMFLSVESVVIRRLPGEAYIGVTVPNATRVIPLWRDNLSDPATPGIPLNLGVDEHGKRFINDLTALPHLLVAGSTGSGKSVMLRSLVTSLAFWSDPSEIKLVLSDTKQVEYTVLEHDSHLWYPRCTTTMETLQAMDGLIQEMERRLKSLAQHGVMNIHQLTPGRRPPYIVLVIDELADFMGKSADKEVSKLATAKLGLIVQRSRATGVHVIAATQRPSVDVVTGTVKSNFPARLSFRLPTEADSRTILGHSGAENLLSVGDCWYQSPLAPQTRRLHSYYATLQDITQCLELANSSLLPRGSLWKTPASVN
jgi:S-DNA-T family DNA segregation ATPase FtsK/SpoIIIE